jgi:uncharacterized protein
MEFFLCVLGMVLVIEGLPYFGFPESMKGFMRVVMEQDESTLRLVGAFVMFMGLVILFLARKGIASL